MGKQFRLWQMQRLTSSLPQCSGLPGRCVIQFRWFSISYGRSPLSSFSWINSIHFGSFYKRTGFILCKLQHLGVVAIDAFLAAIRQIPDKNGRNRRSGFRFYRSYSSTCHTGICRLPKGFRQQRACRLRIFVFLHVSCFILRLESDFVYVKYSILDLQPYVKTNLQKMFYEGSSVGRGAVIDSSKILMYNKPCREKFRQGEVSF